MIGEANRTWGEERIAFELLLKPIDPFETFYYFVPTSGPRNSSPPNPLLGYINLLY